MQERRWAWGISDDGWMIKNIILNMFSKKFNLRLIYITAHAIWDHLSVGISLLITFGSNVTVLVNPKFSYTVLGVNLPIFSTFLIQLTILFFVFTILLDRYIKPEPTGKKNFIQKIKNLKTLCIVIGVTHKCLKTRRLTGTHQRNRYTPGYRSHQTRHCPAIPDGSNHTQHQRGIDRNYPGPRSF